MTGTSRPQSAFKKLVNAIIVSSTKIDNAEDISLVSSEHRVSVVPLDSNIAPPNLSEPAQQPPQLTTVPAPPTTAPPSFSRSRNFSIANEDGKSSNLTKPGTGNMDSHDQAASFVNFIENAVESAPIFCTPFVAPPVRYSNEANEQVDTNGNINANKVSK